MSLSTRIKQDMQAALRSGDKPRLGALRMALAAITQREVDTRETLGDDAVETVLERMIKQGRDAASQFRKAGRTDLADKEDAEIEILATYLPEALSTSELTALIGEVVSATGASSMRDMGKVMGEIKQRAAGRVDMSAVNIQVRALLSAD